MNIAIFGSGYVGLVSAACFADVGNNVVCIDVDEQRINKLKQGKVPIFEPGLKRMVRANQREGRLSFTTNASLGVEQSDMLFIAVGTPQDEDGSADLQYVLAVANTIGECLESYKIVVNKSTVPVGTAEKVRTTIQNALDKRRCDVSFDVASNPEFLKEGAAISDFTHPDRVVVGVDNPRVEEAFRLLYAPFNRQHDRLVSMDIPSAELTKYAANAMLATKISFINELSNIAEKVGADIENVRVGIGSDSRIGYSFIYPGAGYGGSCFPKDVQALQAISREHGHEPHLISAIETVNEHQKSRVFNKLTQHFGEDLRGKRIALWGLAFKPNTDDMREAPSRVFMEACWAAGATVVAYDPEAMKETKRIYGKREDLELVKTKEAATKNADCLVLMTEWKNFKSPDFNALKSVLKEPVIIDGRNQYDAKLLQSKGFIYHSIGRRAA